MEEVKTFNFDTGTNSLLASVIPALANKGVDTGALLAMMNNNRGGGFFGNNGFESIIALIIVAALFGNNNGGGIFGGNNSNPAEREMLMTAIQRNGVDISQLSQTIGCSNSRLQDAISQVSTQICNFAGQNGLSFQQVINSIQSGNSALATQICNCCCDLKSAIHESNYLTERGFCNTNQILAKGFSDIGYETQRQTCDLQNTIKDSTSQILAGQAAIEKRELQREIETLREEKQTYKLGNMMSQANAPLAAAISALQSDVDGIKCRLPKTEVIPATPEYVPINRSINVAYTPFNACNYGGWSGNNCFNTGSLWG